MVTFIMLNADEFATLMTQRYPNWETLLWVKFPDNCMKARMLTRLLKITHIDVSDIHNNIYQSRRLKKLYHHIVKNEDRLILWRLL